MDGRPGSTEELGLTHSPYLIKLAILGQMTLISNILRGTQNNKECLCCPQKHLPRRAIFSSNFLTANFNKSLALG
jgi:hypothetical protein